MKYILGVLILISCSNGYSAGCEKTVEQSFEWIQKYPKVVDAFRIDSAEKLYSLKSLYLQDVVLNDSDIDYLCPLENLVNLELVASRPASKVTGETLYKLRGLEKLEVLGLGSFEFHLANVAGLCQIRSLEVILFADMQLVGGGLGKLNCLPEIAILGLFGSAEHPVVDANLAGIGDLSKDAALSTLVISNSSITDRGLNHLDGLSVDLVEITDANISPGRGLKYVARNPRMMMLDLSNRADNADTQNAITPAFLGYLCQSPYLFSLSIRYNKLDSLDGLGCIDLLLAVDLYGNPLEPEDLRVFLNFEFFSNINIEKEIAESDHEVIQQLKAKFGDDLFTSRPNGLAPRMEGVKDAYSQEFRRFRKVSLK